ncbi:MAG: serine hydrolase [Candidatus Bipolaricaulia bacterium]
MIDRLITIGIVVVTLIGGGLMIQQSPAPTSTGTNSGLTTAQEQDNAVQTPSQQPRSSETVQEATSGSTPLEGLDAYVKGAMETWNVPGTAIAVVKDDEVVFAEGYGVRNDNTGKPVTARTLFAVGSTTKAFTTAALGMLVDEGKISWDEKVVNYLPDFQLKDPWITRHLTIRDLLTHRVGLKRADLLWYSNKFNRDQVLQRIRNVEHKLRFRDQFGYQNAMYVAAGEIIESVTGQSWSTFVQNRIFNPLGMLVSNTSTDDLAYYSDVAMPHIQSSASEVRPIDYHNIDNAAPAGAINSNVQEMAQWVRLQLNEGTYEGQRLLEASTVRAMHSPETIIDPGPTQARLNPETTFSTYGLGWFVDDYRGHKAVYHGGNIDGMSAHVSMVPEEELGVVVLTNMNATPMPKILSKWITDRYLQAPEKDWSQHYRQIYEKIGQQRQQALQKVRENRTSGTEPSLGLERYAGVYESDLYGKLTIRAEDDGLILQYGDLVGDLTHWQYDTFRVSWPPSVRAVVGGFFLANIHLDARGNIQSLELSDALGRLELGEFKRVGDVGQP